MLGSFMLSAESWASPHDEHWEVWLGFSKRDSGQPDMTGLLQQEEHNPGEGAEGGDFDHTQQCMEQLGRSLLREAWGPTVSPKQEMPRAVQAQGQQRFGAEAWWVLAKPATSEQAQPAVLSPGLFQSKIHHQGGGAGAGQGQVESWEILGM